MAPCSCLSTLSVFGITLLLVLFHPHPIQRRPLTKPRPGATQPGNRPPSHLLNANRHCAPPRFTAVATRGPKASLS